MLKSNQIDKQECEASGISPQKNNKSRPVTSIFNKLAGTGNPSSKKSTVDMSDRDRDSFSLSRIKSNKTDNPYNIKGSLSNQHNSIFQTTVDESESKKLAKYNSYGKMQNEISERNDTTTNSNAINIPNFPSSSGNKNKIGLSKYSHVFGDSADDKLAQTKFDTTRSATSTRAGGIVRFGSNKAIISVNPCANTETDEVLSKDSNLTNSKQKKVVSLFNIPFSKYYINFLN